MKTIKLYICDKRTMIADGECDGSGCVDCEPHCWHTADINYAKYDQKHNTNKWETVVLNDIHTGNPIITEWEVDPERNEYDETLS